MAITKVNSQKHLKTLNKQATILLNLTNIDPKIPRVVKKFDPSYVTRYVIIAELVKALSRTSKNKPFKILDAGGYNGAARDLLPEHSITIIDLFKDNQLENYISYDGGVMPFKDNEFDMVISCDTLEHVPGESRELFLKEIGRVSNNYVLLCAPFNSKEIEAAELRSDIFYQGLTGGESYIWLKEHREYVLPERKNFISTMAAQNFHATSFDHTSIDLWEIMLRSSFFLAGNYEPIAPETALKLEKANDNYLKNYTFSDFPSIGYRTFFVCSKQHSVKVKLPKYRPEETVRFVTEQIKLTGQCISDFSKQFGAVRDQYIALQEESQKLYNDSVAILKQRDELNERLAKIHSIKAIRIAKKAKNLRKRLKRKS